MARANLEFCACRARLVEGVALAVSAGVGGIGRGVAADSGAESGGGKRSSSVRFSDGGFFAAGISRLEAAAGNAGGNRLSAGNGGTAQAKSFAPQRVAPDRSRCLRI